MSIEWNLTYALSKLGVIFFGTPCIHKKNKVEYPVKLPMSPISKLYRSNSLKNAQYAFMQLRDHIYIPKRSVYDVINA